MYDTQLSYVAYFGKQIINSSAYGVRRKRTLCTTTSLTLHADTYTHHMCIWTIGLDRRIHPPSSPGLPVLMANTAAWFFFTETLLPPTFVCVYGRFVFLNFYGTRLLLHHYVVIVCIIVIIMWYLSCMLCACIRLGPLWHRNVARKKLKVRVSRSSFQRWTHMKKKMEMQINRTCYNIKL